MAIDNSRWLIAGVGGCGLIWYATLHRRPPEPPSADVASVDAFVPPAARRNPVGQLARQISATNERLRSLELRDSIVRVAPATSGLTVLVDPIIARVSGGTIEQAIRDRWTLLGIPPGRRTVIAVVADTSAVNHGLPRNRAFGMPIETFMPASDGDACISILHPSFVLFTGPAPQARVKRNLSSAGTINALVSPCAFIARFGLPGPQIRDWLVRSNWAPATLADWTEETESWRPQLGNPRAANSLERFTLKGERESVMRSYISPAGVSCIIGDAGACRSALFVRARSRDSAWTSGVMSSSGTSPSMFYALRRPRPLGPAENSILSEMVRTLGAQRFAAFWASSLPPTEAFETASGGATEKWLGEWMRRIYGTASAGPALSSIAAVTGVLVLIIGLGGSMLIGMRRRIA